MLDRRGSAVLSEDACLRHLESAATTTGTGRIAINGARSPYVIPVNFTMLEDKLVIRLGKGFAAYSLDGIAVTFEADEVAPTLHSGWSVVVEGVARILPYEEVARLGSNLPAPIVAVPGVRVFEISPFKVTGREVEPDLRGERRDLGAGSTEQGDEPVKALLLGRSAVQELASVLASVLADLSSEIADTDNAIFRRTLRDRRQLLEGIVAQLPSTDAP